jgi:hypothetical protein
MQIVKAHDQEIADFSTKVSFLWEQITFFPPSPEKKDIAEVEISAIISLVTK